MMDSRTLIKDLLILTGRSASSLASETGLHRSNVTHWLKTGESSVGVERQGELLKRLGVSGGSLFSDRVHSWTLKSSEELVPLARVLSWASPGPFEMVYLVPDNFNFKMEELEGWGTEDNPLAIYDFKKKIRILFRRKQDPSIPDSESIESLVDSGRTEWREPHSVRLELKIFKNWWAGNISVEEYARILGPGNATGLKGETIPGSSLTWESFVIKMERRGIRPEEVLGMIDRGKEGNK